MSSNPNVISNQLSSMTVDELDAELKLQKEKGNRDEGMEIFQELKRRDDPTKTSESKNSFDNKFEDLSSRMQDKNSSNYPSTSDFEEFFQNDVKGYKSKVDANLDAAMKYKDDKIEDLKSQLNEQLIAPPKLREYVSPERIHLSTIYKNIQKCKDREHIKEYPMNFLVYAAAETDKVYFGIRKSIKRKWIKATMAWSPEKIQSELQTIENKLNTSNDEKSPRKKNLKIAIRREIQDAKIYSIKKQAKVFNISKQDLDMNIAA